MPTRQSCIKAAACGQALPGYRQRQSRYPLRAGRKSAAPDRHRTTRPHTELTSSRVPRQVLGAAAKPKQFLESIFRPEVDQNTQPCAITATQGRIACVCMAPPPVLGEAPHFLEHGCATYASQENTGILRWAWPTRTGTRANMLRYHILTHALDSQRLNLPSGRINEAGASWQRGRKEVERREDCAGVLVLAVHKGTKQDQGVQHSGAGDARVRVGRGHRRGCVA